MRSKILLMLLLAICIRTNLYAQANCTNPPDCILNFGTNLVGGTSGITGNVVNSGPGNMVNDWSVLTGTPIFGQGMNGSSGINLVSDASSGEGMYACYNFRSGKTYDVCLYAKNLTYANVGNFIIEAYNSTTGASQVIKNYVNFFESPAGLPQLKQNSFTTTGSFNQLRIYTNSAPNMGNPFSVVFDDVQVTEVPVLTAGASLISGCGSTTLTASSTNTLNVSWSPSGSVSPSTGAVVTARPCQNTVYTATYSSTCQGGCVGTRQISVDVQPGVNATANPTTIDACGSATLTATSTNSMQVTWSGAGLVSTTGSVVTARPCVTTTYTATFRCVQTGCTYTKQVTVYVQPNATATASPTTINGCGSSTLTASSTNPMQVTWSGPGLTPTTGNTLNVSPCSTTTYMATFLCTQTGCVYNRYVTVTVQPGTSVTATPSTISGCGSSTLTASSTNPMSVSWSPSYWLSATTGTTVQAAPCSTYNYMAQFYCAQNQCTYYDSTTVNVLTNAIINNTPNPLCGGAIDLQYDDNGTPCPNNSYLWIGPNGTGTRTGPVWSMSSSTPASAGTYTLIVTKPQGCKDTFYTLVTMVGCCDIVADFNMVGINPVRFENMTTSHGSQALSAEWHWDLGDGTLSSIRNPAHAYVIPPAADFEVCMSAVVFDEYGNTCCDKICKMVHIPDHIDCMPKTAFGYKVLNPVTRKVQFVDQTAYMGTKTGWQWKVNGVIQPTTLQNPIINLPPPPPGSTPPYVYNICLEAINIDWMGVQCPEEWCEDILIP